MEHVRHTLEPIFDSHSRFLILGTIPSPQSRANGFYYGHPQNRFWRVLAAVLGVAMPIDNESKRNLLLANGIALWDVLQSCEIEGASDGSIRNPVPNDISRILQAAPVEQIFTTGKTAFHLYERLCLPRTGRSAHYLPSTSPANCRMSLNTLIAHYLPLTAGKPPQEIRACGEEAPAGDLGESRR